MDCPPILPHREAFVAENEKRGGQKGPQQHAEGQRGERTHKRFLEEMAEGSERERAREEDLSVPHVHPERHRLTQQREQHDEAEKNSEKNREERMIDQGGEWLTACVAMTARAAKPETRRAARAKTSTRRPASAADTVAYTGSAADFLPARPLSRNCGTRPPAVAAAIFGRWYADRVRRRSAARRA